MTKKQPVISVILPVYNAGQYLKYAVDSILEQTHKDFELLLIDDGSTDESSTIIDTYAKADPRVVAIHQDNMGLVATLNKGVRLARGKYIARMDADDISLPRRFEVQVSLLESTEGAVLCASCFDVIDENNEFVRLGVAPAIDEDLKRSMYLYNPIAHGSVMVLKEALIAAGEYSDTVGPTEDFDLWIRLARQGNFVFSERSLFRWRMNPTGITHSQNEKMQDATKKLVLNLRNKQPIKPYSATKMRLRGNEYIEKYGSIGVIMKEIVLEDNYNLGIKAFKEGHPLDGARYISSVALTGRKGLSISINRTFDYTSQKVKNLFK